MDCPHSILGGRNSIEIVEGDNREEALKRVLRSGSLQGWIHTEKHNTVVRAASTTRNISWWRCIADGE